MIMRGLLWYLRLIAKGNSRAAAQFILQPQYTENPYNILSSLYKFLTATLNCRAFVMTPLHITNVLRVVGACIVVVR